MHGYRIATFSAKFLPEKSNLWLVVLKSVPESKTRLLVII